MRVVSYTRTTSCYPGECPTNDVIGMQNERIKSYADAKGWRIQNKYSDRKKDSSENAAFEQLLQDGLKRKFDAVIFDSVFRAGKDLWGAKRCFSKPFIMQEYRLPLLKTILTAQESQSKRSSNTLTSSTEFTVMSISEIR